MFPNAPHRGSSSSSSPAPQSCSGCAQPAGRPGESGFSLIELLVVILIIGILAAIAVPIFLSSKGKALDAQAKELARTAETTAESLAVDHDGSYVEVSRETLHAEEPSIPIVAGTTAPYLSAASGEKSSYTVTVTATNGDEFTISRNASGEVSRQCASPRNGCSGSATSSW